MRKQLPVVTPLNLSDFENALTWKSSNDSVLGEAFGKVTGSKYNYLFSSGRAALYTALSVLKSKSDKKYVIIPAYTCPTVALSVARAGLRVRLCDIDLKTLNMDLDLLPDLIDEKTLAVVVAHFYGFPCDMDRLIKIVGSSGTFLIEDVAQAMGAKYKGKRLGTFGDLGCFSLNRGKCMTTYNGGVLTTDNENYASEIESTLYNLNTPGKIRQISTYIKLMGMHLCSRPGLWWFISKLPLGFEEQHHSIDFRVEKLPDWQVNFGCSVLERLDEVNSIRRQNGGYLVKYLEKTDGLKFPQVLHEAEAVYLRLPLIVGDIEKRNRIYRELHRRGIGASKLYIYSLNRYDYLREIVPRTGCPKAEYVAQRILTLPTHPLMSRRDMNLILDVFDSTC